jgi:hypothetical protein
MARALAVAFADGWADRDTAAPEADTAAAITSRTKAATRILARPGLILLSWFTAELHP